MKQEEVKAMTMEMQSFVSDVVRKVPSEKSEELGYIMTMALLFHEIAQHQVKRSAAT